MFYEACLAGGTDPQLAKLMYAAVYLFGPKWGDAQPRGNEQLQELIAPERIRLGGGVGELGGRRGGGGGGDPAWGDDGGAAR